VVFVSKRAGARRLQDSIVDLHRITNSRKLDRSRATRSGVALSPVAGAVLRHVAAEGPVRPAALADRMRMQPSALSRQLKNLEELGCIDRIASPDDGRGAILRTTRRGRGMVQRLERADEAILAEQLSSWSAADLDTLNDLLDRLIHDLRTPASPTRARKAAS
jgi:DNA-binding MarR family transcriptional regulator